MFSTFAAATLLFAGALAVPTPSATMVQIQIKGKDGNFDNELVPVFSASQVLNKSVKVPTIQNLWRGSAVDDNTKIWGITIKTTSKLANYRCPIQDETRHTIDVLYEGREGADVTDGPAVDISNYSVWCYDASNNNIQDDVVLATETTQAHPNNPSVNAPAPSSAAPSAAASTGSPIGNRISFELVDVITGKTTPTAASEVTAPSGRGYKAFGVLFKDVKEMHDPEQPAALLATYLKIRSASLAGVACRILDRSNQVIATVTDENKSEKFALGLFLHNRVDEYVLVCNAAN